MGRICAGIAMPLNWIGVSGFLMLVLAILRATRRPQPPYAARDQIGQYGVQSGPQHSPSADVSSLRTGGDSDGT